MKQSHVGIDHIHILYKRFIRLNKGLSMLHDINDHYPIYLTVSKARWKRCQTKIVWRYP